MGLLDQVIGGMMNQTSGGLHGGSRQQGGQSPILMALMALLSGGMGRSGGAGGGLGGLLGGLTGTPGGMGGAGSAGGLGDLLSRFQQNGHGDTINSWVGTGENRPIAPNDLEQALGRDTVDGLSSQTGLPKGDLLSELSRMLPGVVDKMTPHGRLPNENELSKW